MATAPAAAKQALPTDQTGNLVANVQALLQTLGGTKTTTSTNPGDTAALQAALSQLQGADYNAMLQSIFQQAGGQIPGIQQAMGNAIGARSGGNSAVAAALQKLLQQTTIAGQDQIAKQQLANLQQQVQAGQAVAQATKGTQATEQKGTNIGQGVSTAAKLTAGATALQSLLKLTGQGTLQDAIGKLTGGTPSYSDTAGNYVAPNTPGDQEFMRFMMQSAQPVTTAVPAPAAPQMSMASNQQQFSPAVTAALQQLLGSEAPAMSAGEASTVAPAGAEVGPDMSYADWTAPALDINAIIGNVQPTPEMSYAPEDMFAPAFNINDYLY